MDYSSFNCNIAYQLEAIMQLICDNIYRQTAGWTNSKAAIKIISAVKEEHFRKFLVGIISIVKPS